MQVIDRLSTTMTTTTTTTTTTTNELISILKDVSILSHGFMIVFGPFHPALLPPFMERVIYGDAKATRHLKSYDRLNAKVNRCFIFICIMKKKDLEFFNVESKI